MSDSEKSTVPSNRPPGRPADPDLRDRRENEILDVAAPVFAEFGYDGTDVQVIADRVQVGKGTVYRYFGNKENLFLAALERGLRRCGVYIEQRIDSDDPITILEQSMRGMLEYFDLHKEVPELIILERAVFKDRKKPIYFQLREQSLDKWRGMFKQLIAAGQIHDMPVDRMMDVLNDLMYGACFTSHFAGRSGRTFEQQADDVILIAFGGILTDSEREKRFGAANHSTESK